MLSCPGALARSSDRRDLWIAGHSSALVAYALHNAGEVLGLGFSPGARGFRAEITIGKYTYELKRMSILASILNALIIFATMTIAGSAAAARLTHAAQVNENIVMWVAGTATMINGFTSWLFIKTGKKVEYQSHFLHPGR